MEELAMEFRPVTFADWRAQVEKELGGRSFEAALVHEALEHIRIAPLYTEGPLTERAPRHVSTRPFRICMHTSASDLAADVEGGADAVWVELHDAVAHASVAAQTFVIVDVGNVVSPEYVDHSVVTLAKVLTSGFALNLHPLARCDRGHVSSSHFEEELRILKHLAGCSDERASTATVLVSTLPYHDAGADAADELAIALSTGVRYLDVLLEAGLSPERAARQIAVQVAAGRDTFVELCKMRALRVCWEKLLAAVGVTNAPPLLVHAVCSSRTLTMHDPWVNMLRVTTQMFSAILGGADLITPNTFDQNSGGAPSTRARRVARNTGLILREESFLGKVADPAGGSYYFDTLTDALAREAWQRFRALEREGGITAALETGRLSARLEALSRDWLARIAKRKVPILGVSEFANLDETLPNPYHRTASALRPADAWALHRDAAAFELLRAYADALDKPVEALLITLGPFAESRARAGFAAGLFAAGGIRTRESTTDEKAAIACICGTDERYAAEAVSRAQALKALGCPRVLLAGRPGKLEAQLREAGVDGFIFVGCDVVAVLSEILGVPS